MLTRIGLIACLLMISACGTRTGLRLPRTDASAPTDAPVGHDAQDATDTGIVFNDVLDPCLLPGLGLDNTGCAFPDGTRVPFGAEVTHGCVRCQCSESGDLFCLNTCPHEDDDGGPGIALHCTLPDGRRVLDTSLTLVGSVWCYCDSGGGTRCQLGPCTDGGGIESPPPILGTAGAACNSVPLNVSAVPTVQHALGGPLPPSGGAVRPGTYVLDHIVVYTGGMVGATRPATIQATGRGWEIARYSPQGASIERASFEVRFTVGTNELQLWETCPVDTRPRVVTFGDGGTFVLDAGQPYLPRYNAQPNGLELYTDGTPATVFVYRLQ